MIRDDVAFAYGERSRYRIAKDVITLMRGPSSAVLWIIGTYGDNWKKLFWRITVLVLYKYTATPLRAKVHETARILMPYHVRAGGDAVRVCVSCKQSTAAMGITSTWIKILSSIFLFGERKTCSSHSWWPRSSRLGLRRRRVDRVRVRRGSVEVPFRDIRAITTTANTEARIVRGPRPLKVCLVPIRPIRVLLPVLLRYGAQCRGFHSQGNHDPLLTHLDERRAGHRQCQRRRVGRRIGTEVSPRTTPPRRATERYRCAQRSQDGGQFTMDQAFAESRQIDVCGIEQEAGCVWVNLWSVSTSTVHDTIAVWSVLVLYDVDNADVVRTLQEVTWTVLGLHSVIFTQIDVLYSSSYCVGSGTHLSSIFGTME
jgi:hypothetical protein